jgi:hypothetical protein
VHDQSKSVAYRMQVDLPYFGITAQDREPMVYPDVAFDAPSEEDFIWIEKFQEAVHTDEVRELGAQLLSMPDHRGGEVRVGRAAAAPGPAEQAAGSLASDAQRRTAREACWQQLV